MWLQGESPAWRSFSRRWSRFDALSIDEVRKSPESNVSISAVDAKHRLGSTEARCHELGERRHTTRLGAGSAPILDDLQGPQVAEAVAGSACLCLLPIGASEQHGRHLPIDTDVMIAPAICHAASAHTGLPVLPSLCRGLVAGH